jgi:hypothetical protein
MSNPREFQDCRSCHKLGEHTNKAGCILAVQAAEAANTSRWAGPFTEWGYRFPDGFIMPMNVVYSAWEVDRFADGKPDLLTEIQGQPVTHVKRTISEWEPVT